MKKLLNVIMTDKLILRVFSPGKEINGPGFLTTFLFQTTLASAVGLMTGKTAVVFALTLFLFIRLVRARIGSTGSSFLTIPLAIIMSAGVSLSVMIERCMIYFYDYNLLTRGMTIESAFMHNYVIAVRFVIASSMILTLVLVGILSIFPAENRSWSRWMKKYTVPIFSLSGAITRTSYIYLLFVIQIIAIVIAVITSVIVIFLSLKIGGISTPGYSVIPVLVIASLIFCAIFFASICALLRRIRDLGRSWPFLILVITLSVLEALSLLAFNPASSNLLITFIGDKIGLSLWYWFNFYVNPVFVEFLAAIRMLWAAVILYLIFYPGKSADKR